MDEQLTLDKRNRRRDKEIKGEEMLIRCHRAMLSKGLNNKGNRKLFDRAEGEPGGGWRIHLFLVNADALAILPLITAGHVGPGDPLSFDRRQFVEWRLRCTELCHRRTGRWEWVGDDFP